MARDVSDLEPAERDPARLRSTALMIGAVMLAGGVLVVAAYTVKLRAEADSGRPPIVARLMTNFGARDQHNRAFAMSQLEGCVSLVTPVATREPEAIRESLRVMKLVAGKFPGDQGLRFVGVTIDPARDDPPRMLEFMKAFGVADDPRWSFVQAEETHARNYLRNQLRLGEVRETPAGGGTRLEFPSMIALVDPHLHLRGRYDFNEAVAVQEDARRLLREDAAEARRLDAEAHTDDVRKARQHLLRAIEMIRNEDLEAKGGPR